MSASACAEFVDLTTPHLPRLLRIGMRLTRQSCESEDLVQEALSRAWANWGRFERSGSLGAWLARILINTFISRHRHQRVVTTTGARPDLVEHLFDPARVLEAEAPELRWHRTHFSDEVVAALASLPSAYRAVVELVDIEGLPYRDAAERLGCPLGTVMSRLHRARRLLRGQLREVAREHGLSAA